MNYFTSCKKQIAKPKYSQDLDAGRIAHLVQDRGLTLDLVEELRVPLDRQFHLFLELGGLDHRLDQLVLLEILQLELQLVLVGRRTGLNNLLQFLKLFVQLSLLLANCGHLLYLLVLNIVNHFQPLEQLSQPEDHLVVLFVDFSAALGQLVKFPHLVFQVVVYVLARNRDSARLLLLRQLARLHGPRGPE